MRTLDVSKISGTLYEKYLYRNTTHTHTHTCIYNEIDLVDNKKANGLANILYFMHMYSFFVRPKCHYDSIKPCYMHRFVTKTNKK